MSEHIADRYEIVGVLGTGAMAEVLEVVDETSGAILALKRLLPQQSGSRSATLMLKREYETLTQLSHPLIIRAFDYGVDTDRPFYTMERLVGRSLGHLSPLPFRTAASLLRDVASALSLVHSRKLLHRDVSSRNVCRTEDGRAKLIDFGALAPMGSQREVIGTPPFLCPESLELRPLDARADLFSLGALAYLSLTGHHAYPAPRVADLGRVWSRPIAAPSSSAPDIPASLDALVLALLDLNPLVRPGSAAEVHDRLTDIAGLPAAETPEIARAYFLTPNLVARSAQTRRFQRRLERAEERRGGAIVVESERGGGRSRLLSSFLLTARLQGAVVASANACNGPPSPFGVVRALARSLRDSEPALLRLVVSADLGLAHVLGLDAGSADDEGATIAQGAWVSATEQVTRFFVEISRKRPVVIGIDELEACDRPSAAVVAALASAAASEALLVVTTSLMDSIGPIATQVRELGDSIILDPFAANDTRELLSSVFGDVPHLDEIADWIHRLSGGLPKGALDLAQYLVNVGLARYSEGGWALPSSLEGRGLPGGVDAALDARVATLSPGARHIAEALSLTNDAEPLRVAEYEELFDGEIRKEMFRYLNELVSASVLVDTGASYVLSNAETRAAVLRRIPEESLQSLHRRLGNAYRSGPRPVKELAAYHLLHAGDVATAFHLVAEASRDRTDLFARGMGFFRTSVAADMIERLYEWGRAGAPARWEMSHITRVLLQLASIGDTRLARHGPEILEALRRDSGLDLWQGLTDIEDPAQRIARAIGEAYARHASAPDRERRLDPAAALEELAMTAAALAGVHARNADPLSARALEDLVRPLRSLSPGLDVLGQIVELTALTLRGSSARQLRLRLAEQTASPVPGIEEPVRGAIHVLTLYYLALEDVGQGRAVPDDRLALLDGYAPYAPLVWQARMLRACYRGDERNANECRRRRDIAMAGRADVDGHLETSLLYEATAYATVGDLMALKRLVPVLEERSTSRPGWRPHVRLAAGNCHFLRGDHASAAQEYERGLALPDMKSHACRILLLIRVVQSLVELERFEEARRRAQAALDSHAAEPLIPLYFDQLQLALARAEAGSGELDRAAIRARACMARVEERGLSGVVLVNFLVESAVLAHRVGDPARFEELTRRVGVLVSGADSTALATQYARLRAMRQSSTQGEPGSEAAIAAHTIRIALDQCPGPLERGQRALQLLMTHSGAARGFLFLHRARRLELAAAIPDVEPPEQLHEQLEDWTGTAFGSHAQTVTAFVHEIPAPARASSFMFVELLTNTGGEVILAAVAALAARDWSLSRVPTDVLHALGEELLRHGDASGKPVPRRQPQGV